MNNTVSTDMIENTSTYQKIEQFKKNLVIKAENRKVLQSGLIHYRQTNEFPSFLSNTNVKILKDILEHEKRNNNT